VVFASASEGVHCTSRFFECAGAMAMLFALPGVESLVYF
jgi:hypothetical protein